MYFNTIKIKYIYLFLTFLFLFFGTHSEAHVCQSYLTKYNTKSFDPEDAFIIAGLNPEKILLDFAKTPGGDESPSWVFEIKLQTEDSDFFVTIGHMSVWAIDISFKKNINHVPWKNYNIWRTDTAGVDIEGKGLGQLMYLLMAAKFFISYPNKHLISTDHSGSANNMWEALVRKGFAKKFSIDEEGNKVSITEALGTIYEIEKLSLGKKIKDYVRRFDVKIVK